MKERDELRAEIEALRKARTSTPAAGVSKEEVERLKKELGEKEAARAELAAEVAKLKAAMERAREALSAGSPREGGS